MKKPSPQKANTYSIIAALVFAVIALAGRYGSVTVLLPIGVAGMLCAVGFKVVFYRCPACGKYLGRAVVKHCPHCGEKID